MLGIGNKATFSMVSWAVLVTLKEEGCSECQNSRKIGCSKPMAHTALKYFTKFGIYWDEERAGRPRITSVEEI